MKLTGGMMMKYNSQARENQDRFALAILDSKENGTYVEVGGYLNRVE